MSKSRGKLFETGRELLLQELLGYELGLTSQEDLWPRLKVALPKSDRVKRHIKRLLNAYLENREEIDIWIDHSLKSKSFAAYSDLEKMIMRLAVVETRFFGDEKMMPIIVSKPPKNKKYRSICLYYSSIMGNKQFLFYFEFMSVIFCLRRAISWVRRVILSDCFDTVTVVARLYKIKYPRPNKNKREGGFLCRAMRKQFL